MEKFYSQKLSESETAINELEVADKFDLTLGKAKKRTVNVAISNTFGFGGHITCSIFKKYKERCPHSDTSIVIQPNINIF